MHDDAAVSFRNCEGSQSQGLVTDALQQNRALDPSIAFAGINLQTHTAKLWGSGGDGGDAATADGSHKLSWTTLPWAAEGIAQILLSSSSLEKIANTVVPIRAFEASQSDIVAVLEKIQNTTYEVTSQGDSETIISKAQQSWKQNRDIGSALALVKAGFFLDGYGSDFVSEGITQIGNDFLELPSLDFETVIAEAAERWA